MKIVIVLTSHDTLGETGKKTGFWLEEFASPYFQAGKVKHKETVVVGLDQAPDAFIGLFRGQNIGKMVVKLV